MCFFIVACVLYFFLPQPTKKVLGKSGVHDLNNWVTKLVLVDLTIVNRVNKSGNSLSRHNRPHYLCFCLGLSKSGRFIVTCVLYFCQANQEQCVQPSIV